MRNTAIIVTLLMIGAALPLPFGVVSGMRGIANYLPLHILLETFSIVVAMLIFAVGWHAHNRNLPGNFVLLACVFFGVGVLNFSHMLSFAGMPDFVTPSNPEKAIDFWLVSQSLSAVALLAVAVMPWRPFSSDATRYVLLVSVVAATALAHWLILFHQHQLPHTFVPGLGLTRFKIGSEYAIITLNLAAALALWIRMRTPQPFNAPALFGAVCVTALGEYFFTLYASVTDVYNLLGHIYKAISYVLLYRAFFVATVETPYRQLQLFQSKLRSTIDAIPDLVWIKNADGVYLECNTAFERLLGAGKAQIIGKTDYDLVSRDQADFFREHDRMTMTANQTRVNEEWVTFAGGRSALVETVKTPMHNDDGTLIGVLGIARDITRRKASEEALHQARQTAQDAEMRYRTVADFTYDWEAWIGNRGNWLYCSPSCMRITGHAAAEFIDNPNLLFDIIHPDDRDAVLANIHKAPGKTGEPEVLNFRIKHTDGRFVWVEQVSQEVFNEAGGRIGRRISNRDITERKNNLAKIRRLNQVYRLLSRVNEAIVRSTDITQLFAAVSDAAIESGLFRFTWVGLLDNTRVIPVTHAGVEEGYLAGKLQIALDDEFTGNGPTGRAIRNGTHIVCQDIEHDPSMVPWRDEALRRGYRASAAFPVSEAGRVAGAINVYATETNFFAPDIVQLMQELAADVSFALDVFAEKKRREQAENEIRKINVELERRVSERTRELEAANRELEAFSYSVSHDLRAPLRSIDGFSQVLLKTYHDRLDATGKDWLERVRRASQHMGHLIDDVLQLSQVSRHTLKRSRLDLGEIARSVADDLRSTFPPRQVQFILQEGLLAHGDYNLMRIVMDNLLGNAWKYTGRKAEAEIELGARDIDGERVFFVRDNGAGFNMKYAHKLFVPFQRLHGANEYEGTGIGLATVQRIIHRHRGRVWAEARDGQGATFYFTLPQRDMETRDRNGQ